MRRGESRSYPPILSPGAFHAHLPGRGSVLRDASQLPIARTPRQGGGQHPPMRATLSIFARGGLRAWDSNRRATSLSRRHVRKAAPDCALDCCSCQSITRSCADCRRRRSCSLPTTTSQCARRCTTRMARRLPHPRSTRASLPCRTRRRRPPRQGRPRPPKPIVRWCQADPGSWVRAVLGRDGSAGRSGWRATRCCRRSRTRLGKVDSRAQEALGEPWIWVLSIAV